MTLEEEGFRNWTVRDKKTERQKNREVERALEIGARETESVLPVSQSPSRISISNLGEIQQKENKQGHSTEKE